MESRSRLIVITGLVTLAMVLVAKYILPLLAPLVIGLILASILEPPVVWLERRGHVPRGPAAVLLLITALIATGTCLILVCFQLYHGLRGLFPDGSEAHIAAWVQGIIRSGDRILAGLPPPMREGLLALFRELPTRLGTIGRQILVQMSHLPEVFALVILGVVAAYFFIRDRAMIGRLLLSLTPREWHGRAVLIRDRLTQAFTGFIRAYAVLFILVAVTGWLGLTVLGLDQALLLGVVLGLLDFLPLIGPGIMLLPWAGFCLAAGDWARGLGLILLFLVLAVGRETTEARLVGHQLGLHPLAALTASYIGLRIFGVTGVLIGPVLLIVLRVFYQSLCLSAGDAAKIARREHVFQGG